MFVQDPDAETEAGGEMSSKEKAGPPQDVEEWNLLVKQLEDVLTLKNLLNLGKKNNITEVTVSKILEGGRGGYSGKNRRRTLCCNDKKRGTLCFEGKFTEYYFNE